MYMQGFVSYLSGSYASTGYETPQCLSLWFEDWVLNSAGKFAAACFGCLLLGEWETRFVCNDYQLSSIISFIYHQ